MRLRIGNYLRPNRESRRSISYTPKYDARRRLSTVAERWEITGRLVSDDGTQSGMDRALQELQAAILQPNPSLTYLHEDTGDPSVLALRSDTALYGPLLISSTLPGSANSIYGTAIDFVLVYEAEYPVAVGGNILEFRERLREIPGGQTRVMVGGYVNAAQRQIGYQNKKWGYIQSGRAVGLFGYPTIPPPIFPAALMGEPEVERIGPVDTGNIPTRFEITWQYSFEWHQKLYGTPHYYI